MTESRGDEPAAPSAVGRQETNTSLLPWTLGALAASLSALIWLTVGPLGVLVVIAVSASVEVIARRIFSQRVPFGVLGGLNAGLFGGWLGGSFLDQHFGPSVGGISLIPALLGATNARILVEVLRDRVISRWDKPKPD